MEVGVYSLFDESCQKRNIDKPVWTIGRDAVNDLVLSSPFVSRIHARVSLTEHGLKLENCGLNGTTVDGREVASGASVQVPATAEIHIGEFILSLGPETGQTAPASLSKNEALRELVDLERKIHDQLLDRVDPRQHGLAQNRGVEREQVLKHVLQLFDDSRGEISPDLENFVVKESLILDMGRELRRRVLKKPPTGDRPPEAGLADPKLESSIARVRDAILRKVSLGLRVDTLRDDTSRLESFLAAQSDWTGIDLRKGTIEYILRTTVVKHILDTVFGLGPLEDLLNQPDVSEIMVVNKDRVYVERNGLIERAHCRFLSEACISSIIERMVAPVGQRIDFSKPLVDARLPDGSRINAVIRPLAVSGASITIRKFSKDPFTIDDLLEFGTLSSSCAVFLKACVLGRMNIIVAGGTGSGKTTLLNVLSACIGENERVVTIEETAELQLRQEHVVRLEAKPPSVEGHAGYSIRDLVRNALRMRPDRVIVGECRGAEAFDMLQAMNTGHDGSLTTAHANSPHELVQRLETMVLTAVEIPIRAIRQQIASAIDVIVQIRRLPDGRRRVTHVSEIADYDERTESVVVIDVFRTDDPQGEDAAPTGHIPRFADKLVQTGVLPLEELYAIPHLPAESAAQ